MNNLVQNYEKILELLHSTCSDILSIKQYRVPKMSDIELASLNFATECMSFVCDTNATVHSFDFTPASVHYVKYLNDIKYNLATANLLAIKDIPVPIIRQIYLITAK